MICIRKAPGLNLSRDAVPRVLLFLLHSQEHTRIVHKIRPRPLPATSFPIKVPLITSLLNATAKHVVVKQTEFRSDRSINVRPKGRNSFSPLSKVGCHPTGVHESPRFTCKRLIPMNFMVTPCINNIQHYFPTDAHNVKKRRVIKTF